MSRAVPIQAAVARSCRYSLSPRHRVKPSRRAARECLCVFGPEPHRRAVEDSGQAQVPT